MKGMVIWYRQTGGNKLENKISTYTIQCPVTFGVDSIETLGNDVKMFGVKKVFVMYDKGVESCGIAERVLNILKAEKLDVLGYSDFSGEPIAWMVDKAGDAAKEFEAEMVIGVGGGVAMDNAKLVSVLLANDGPIENYFLSKGVFFTLKKHAPVIAVTTVSGTGSESTCVAVVSDNDHNKDGVICACDKAIVDPGLTLSAPPSITANSGFDALAHAVESYSAGPLDPVTGTGNDPFSSVIALEAIRLITENLEKCYDDGNDLDARIALSKASNWAGIAFSNTGVHFGHSAGHEIGAVYNLPHGLACTYTLPLTTLKTAEFDPERGKNMAIAMGLDVSENDTPECIGKAMQKKVVSMMRHCGIPKMSEKGIKREDVVKLAHAAIQHNGFYHNTIRPVSEEEFAEYIGEMFDISEQL